ncbi:MAG TPA: TrmH family RNA methyltransferase [Oscillatoriaceae cyanobacterium]
MAPSLLARTRIVLEHPFFPENIGSVARAMRNTGLSRLVVAGGASPAHPNAHKLAVGAVHLLEAAEVTPDLEGALAGASLVIGTTCHPFKEIPPLSPRDAAALATGHDGEVAIVFGNEKNGLPIDALRHCHAVVRIPSPVPDASLNLAQAVLILCYEWMLAEQGPGPSDPLVSYPAIADDQTLARVGEQLEDVLTRAGYFKPHNANKRRGALLRLLGRLRLTEEEALLLFGAARHLDFGLESAEAQSLE